MKRITVALIMALAIYLHFASAAVADEKPPLNKTVCVVDSNVFHTVDATLGVFLKNILHGPNTKKAVWEKTGNQWILRMSYVDPVAGKAGTTVMAFEPFVEDKTYVCVSRLIVDNREAKSRERLMFVFTIAESLGLSYR